MTTLGSQYRGTREFPLVYSALVEAARNHHLVYYRDVAKRIGVPKSGHHMARQVGQVLGEISEDEHKAGRPMLSAIAVSEAGVLGEGFFNLARRLGRLDGSTREAEEAFLRSEQQRVYEIWRVDDPDNC
jgi:hypothetical protein